MPLLFIIWLNIIVSNFYSNKIIFVIFLFIHEAATSFFYVADRKFTTTCWMNDLLPSICVRSFYPNATCSLGSTNKRVYMNILLSSWNVYIEAFMVAYNSTFVMCYPFTGNWPWDSGFINNLLVIWWWWSSVLCLITDIRLFVLYSCRWSQIFWYTTVPLKWTNRSLN